VIAAALKGYDNIDMLAAAQRGITVSIVEDLLTEPTAELAVALMLAAARRRGGSGKGTDSSARVASVAGVPRCTGSA